MARKKAMGKKQAIRDKERRDEERRRLLGPGMPGRAAEALIRRRRRMRSRLED